MRAESSAAQKDGQFLLLLDSTEFATSNNNNSNIMKSSVGLEEDRVAAILRETWNRHDNAELADYRLKADANGALREGVMLFLFRKKSP